MATQAKQEPVITMWSKEFTYDRWMKSIGIPIHTGYYIEDLRTIEVEWWEERQCKAAFIQLFGQEGVSSARVSEIAPRKSLPPVKFALDELVYVLSGRGLTTVWGAASRTKKSFEWQEHALFLVPRNHYHVFSNMQGDKPVRLFHYSYMPMAMSALPDPELYFNNPFEATNGVTEGDFYSEAKLIQAKEFDEGLGLRGFWYGNFFPDMRAWNKLDANERRGAGGKSVFIQFPNSELTAHMSVFAPKTYKKAHRHGPGRAIIIPAGEGYSIMWEEGKEKIVCPWHECSMVTPPNKWFHQHFNAGGDMARYLALHPPMQFHGHAEKIEDRAKDQIEYPDEDPFIRQKFEQELAKHGIQSEMPPECYTNRDYEWSKKMGKQ
jgi:oxalate decarboxylase/phosphoglucose isomerase-like protein (cupin superfamily)